MNACEKFIIEAMIPRLESLLEDTTHGLHSLFNETIKENINLGKVRLSDETVTTETCTDPSLILDFVREISDFDKMALCKVKYVDLHMAAPGCSIPNCFREFVNHRLNKVDGITLRIVTEGYGLSDYRSGRISAFVDAFNVAEKFGRANRGNLGGPSLIALQNEMMKHVDIDLADLFEGMAVSMKDPKNHANKSIAAEDMLAVSRMMKVVIFVIGEAADSKSS